MVIPQTFLNQQQALSINHSLTSTMRPETAHPVHIAEPFIPLLSTLIYIPCAYLQAFLNKYYQLAYRQYKTCIHTMILN